MVLTLECFTLGIFQTCTATRWKDRCLNIFGNCVLSCQSSNVRLKTCKDIGLSAHCNWVSKLFVGQNKHVLSGNQLGCHLLFSFPKWPHRFQFFHGLLTDTLVCIFYSRLNKIACFYVLLQLLGRSLNFLVCDSYFCSGNCVIFEDFTN